MRVGNECKAAEGTRKYKAIIGRKQETYTDKEKSN